MALTREQSIQKYGTESYTAWDEQSAQQDAAAKGLTAKKTTVTTPSVTTTSASVTTPIATPTFNQTSNSNDALVQALISKGYNPTDAANAARNDTSGNLSREYLGGGYTSLPTTPTINLTEQYGKLIDESGISGLETNVNSIESRINQMTSEAADAKSKVNENPWISESSRVGRIAKIDEKLQNAIAPLQKDVANITNQINQKKTDVSNKLNLTTQQYNIDVAANQQNLTNFNSLLSSGALVNATAQDIATLAQQTGLAPSFIQSAIDAAKKASNPLSVGTYTDEGGNLVAYTMDSQGNLVNSKSIGKVQATSTGGGSTAKEEKTANQQAIDSALSANTNSYGHVSPAIWNAALRAYIQDGIGSAAEFNIMYGNLKDPNRTDEGSSSGYILVE